MIRKTQLFNLIDDLVKNNEIFIKDKSPVIEDKEEDYENLIYINIFSKTYKYIISADFKNNYLGCIAEKRRRNNGESWHRCTDLEDGNLTKGTWNRIVKDIMNNEE